MSDDSVNSRSKLNGSHDCNLSLWSGRRRRRRRTEKVVFDASNNMRDFELNFNKHIQHLFTKERRTMSEREKEIGE